jgi:protocatechuate 3,4-dioxygenase beta subunit
MKPATGILFASFLAASIASGGTWRTTLVSDAEPGEPMIVTGTIYARDGKTPAAGVTVHVYHTDAQGYYNRGPGEPRLKGTMVTNEEGEYEYRTIRPAAYPGRRNPAHVHYVLSGGGYSKQYVDLEFEDDPLVGDRARKQSARSAE